MHQQEGGGNLRHGADRRPHGEGHVRHRQRAAEPEMQKSKIGESERHAENEAHEGRARGAHHALEVLLQGRAQVLQKRACESDAYPEFHGLGGIMHRRPQPSPIF